MAQQKSKRALRRQRAKARKRELALKQKILELQAEAEESPSLGDSSSDSENRTSNHNGTGASGAVDRKSTPLRRRLGRTSRFDDHPPQENGTGDSSSKGKDDNDDVDVKPEKMDDDDADGGDEDEDADGADDAASAEIEIEYVSENIQDSSNPELMQFAEVFSKFHTAEQLTSDKPFLKVEPKSEAAANGDDAKEKDKDDQMDDDDDEDEDDDRPHISNRKRKERDRLTIAQLKQVVDRPDLVEMHDPNSCDPTLLIHLKSHRNSVRVPAHWIRKRKYLQGKRGLEKPPFELPQFIQDTGIGEIRNMQQSKDDTKSVKQMQRERMNPKMGKIDIDYSKLSDAFFKFQTKPLMTEHGDIYYEGKEYEAKYNRHKPGRLSSRLREALGMLPNTAPPWLHNMQRYGPPPSYPELKIPGLNAPIPTGCKWGFAVGLWGKPPVDENGFPLYGDPFGQQVQMEDEVEPTVELWGQVGEEESDEEDSDEEVEDSDDDDDDMSGTMSGTLSGALSGTLTGATSMASLASGLETPPVLAIRKDQTGLETPDVSSVLAKQPKQLYQVLEQKDANVGGATFGSSHTYSVDESAGGGATSTSSKRRTGGTESSTVAAQAAAGRVQVALNLDELQSLDEMTIKRKYQEQIDAEREQNEDYRDSGDRPKKRQKKKNKKDDISGFKF